MTKHMEEGSFTFHFETRVPHPVEEVFAWHEKPGAFTRLLPPFSKIQLLTPEKNLKRGNQVEFRHSFFGELGINSLHEITYLEKNDCFVDEQLKGPFRAWNHLHKFRRHLEDQTIIEDIIRYKLPLESLLGHLTNIKVAKKLRRVFRYRRDIIRQDLEFQKRYPEKKWHILMTGSSGLVGTSLKALLESMGHIVTPVKRHLQAHENGVFWDIENQKMDLDPQDHYDAVIHLAGENIAGFWTEAKKEAIYKSRVLSTRLLVQSLNQLENPPKVYLSASGINYYPQGSFLDESSPAGEGFLKEVIEDWEGQAETLNKNIRKVFMRTGVVLSPAKGMLQKLLPLYKLGLGSILGSGETKLSWISLDDLIYAYTHVLYADHLSGPINATSPYPIAQKEFSHTLAKLLKKPHFLKVPKPLLNLIFQEMGSETLLSDFEVHPQKLLDDQFQFSYPKLQKALEHLLGLL